jgi:hypothetical protein
MPLDLKQAAIRVLSRHPVYRAFPPGTLRTSATLLYLGERTGADVLDVRKLGRIPTRYLKPATIAAHTAFRSGQDDLVETTLLALEGGFPEAPDVHILWCDLHTFNGRYEEALHSAQRARLLSPTTVSAVARVARLSYRAVPAAEADQIAATAAGRFPRNNEVLWAVCKACQTPDQYERILAVWRAAARPVDLLRAVRPLALAAARTGQVDAAIGLYRDALALAWDKGKPLRKVSPARLEGRGAWSAIVDLARALDGARVPFFFAAGTALGLVREGRPLGADSDIDVGIWQADWDRDALIDLFTRHPKFDLDLHPRSQKVSLRHRGGSPVDVFRYYPDGEKVWHDGVFVRWGNTPFQTGRTTIGGNDLPLPLDTDRYLTENYGDWRTPNPAFDAFTDDAPNVEVTWPEYRRLHHLRRAFHRVSNGDPDGARRDLMLAEESALLDRIGVRS